MSTKTPAANRPKRKAARKPSPKRPAYSRAGMAWAERVRRFGERFVVHKKDRWAGMPFILEPWQWDHIILPIYGRLDRRGKRKYQQALIGLPRWNGKSEIAALCVMYHLFVERVAEGEAYVVASNERQARIVFNTVKRMIQANPLLTAACDIYKGEIWVKETGCVFKALPASADAAQGFHPSLVIIDEVHVHRTRDLIEAMVSGMAAREEPLLVALTTAGKRRAGVLWDILHGSDDVRAWGKAPNTYVFWSGARNADDGHDPAVWRRCNLASWVTDDMLRRQYESLSFSAFERYHLNRFPASTDAEHAFTWDEWQRCKLPPEVDPEGPCVVTVDGAERSDCFGIILDRRDADGFHHVEPHILAEPGPDGYYSLTDIEELLADLWRSRNVTRMALDPARLLLLMQRLERVHGIPVEEFPQSNSRMCPAAGTLRELVRTGKIRAGTDATLEEHILNVTEAVSAYGWRLNKPTRKDKIDGAVALAMAVYLAEAEDGAAEPWIASW